MNNKLFCATWGEGYVDPGERALTLDEITVENGWFEENVQAISEMDIGDVVDCSCISGQLHVLRLA